MTDTTLPQSQYRTVAEIAAILHVSKMTVYRLIDSGALPAIRLGHRTKRVPVEAFEAYRRALLAAATAPAPAPRIPGQTEIIA
ncbi:helix-turn-helix domain-containing protein [Streptomyces longwoodensis]|uniref:helix-turn-helix domain-containing protein n=1 Tax=Streptomyces longwoodensis TaxID=68231 RepID=UPI00382942B6